MSGSLIRQTLVVACLAPLAAWSAPNDAWVERTRVLHPEGNLTFEVRWDPEPGLQLRLAPTNSASKAVLIELTRSAPALRSVPADAFPLFLMDGAQFNPDTLPTNAVAALKVTIKFRPETWSLYLGNRLAAVMPAPCRPPVVLAHTPSALPVEDRRAVRFQKTDDFTFHDDFLVPEDQEDELAAWTEESGDWSLHSVSAERVIEPRKQKAAKRKANRQPKAAMSPNFYSLMGVGTNAVLTAGYDFYDAYDVEAAIQVGQGEGGIVFDYAGDQGYFAFTVRPEEDSDKARLSLWRTTSSNGIPRIELAAVTSEILGGQWIKLKARTFQNRIQCFVDGTRVIDIPAELPVGGRFGLFADADTPLLFDDVMARSNHELDFLGVSDIRRHALVEQGRFFPRARFFNLFPPREEPDLAPPKSGEPQWLILGAVVHPPHVFAADFTPADAGEIGLIAGYTGDDDPYFRFTARRDRASETFRLEKVAPNGVAIVLKQLVLAPAPSAGRAPAAVRLMCDATGGRDIRFYRNEDLVIVYHAEADVGGASGVYVGPDTRVRIANPEYTFERRDLLTDQFEKNTAFVADPFMRHWSSPEGQWDSLTNSVKWYKGDVFGRVDVTLPLADRTSVHLGVPDTSATGAWVVCVRDERLMLRRGGDLMTTNAPAAWAPTNRIGACVSAATNRVTGYTVHAEGHWIWVTSGDALVLQHPLPEPLTGRRLKIEGFDAAHLADSLVRRYNVKDCLFKESLHEWTINGGRWEVINRFQCDPRWSHMNGESTNGLAALWSKYVFKGDFCVEMYAGTRHGWYDRCGDYNLTVLNRDTTPSQGYTVTCSGWDYDQSQLYTKLYRDGAVVAESDAYCAPRSREGNTRKAHLPLVRDGRDVHGAWYYIKFRRAGNRLEYYFDNDLVFACNDPRPLESGSLGVWTYRTSMVVARVKIAAESVASRPVRFTPVPVATARDAAAPDAGGERPPQGSAILSSGRPLDGMRADDWEAADPVSQARLDWHAAADGSPYFTLTSVLGSGSLLARCDAPPVPYPQIAGWRFDVKRTVRGLFNFYYSVGRRDGNGVYVPSKFFFHRISGEEWSKGSYRLTGASTTTGLAASGKDWHSQGRWERVTTWIPADDTKGSESDTGLLVRVEGFGNLQPGYVVQGLTGNGPGEAYAIKDFTAIGYGGAPALSLVSNAVPPLAVTVWSGDGQRALLGPTNWSAATNGLRTLGGTGLTETVISAQWSNASIRLPAAWVRPPPQPAVACDWSGRRPETLQILAGSNYLLRSFAFVNVTVGGLKVQAEPVGLGVAEVPVPRRDECMAGPGSNLNVTVACRDSTNRFTLKWADAPIRPAPVLVNLEGISPIFENFESRPPAASTGSRMRIDGGDVLQGDFATVFNRGPGQRLSKDFGSAFSLARYPVFRFRYRGDVLARVSLTLTGVGVVRFSEKSDQARTVRGSSEPILDNAWHTWQGLWSDAAETFPFRTSALTASSLRFGSCERQDQTGLFTEWSLDDLVAGPAVSQPEQLAFTPHYFDFEGVTQVVAAVRGGVEDFLSLPADQRASLRWTDVTNHVRSTPEIRGLKDGIAHLFLKGRNVRGAESQVTDIPFLVHRRAPKAAGTFEPFSDPMGNGSRLKVTVETGGGAPLDLDALKIRWNDTTVRITNALVSTFTHAPDRDTLMLNWPLIFRGQLDASRAGESFKIILSDIRDGAGNAASDLVLSRRIDYASDHIPPTVLSTLYPANILWSTMLETATGEPKMFSSYGPALVKLVRTNSEVPCLAINVPAGTGGVVRAFSSSWRLEKHPYLAVRLRRPTLATNEETRIDLVFDLKHPTNTVIVGLTPGANTDGRRLALSQPVSWESNVWQSFAIDMESLLKSRLPSAYSPTTLVEKVAIVASSAMSNLTIHVQNMFVFAPWGPNDRVVMDAYDESGIAGTDQEPASAPAHSVVEPVGSGKTADGEGWIMLRVRDKAGNRTAPIYVPVYGRKGGPAAGPGKP